MKSIIILFFLFSFTASAEEGQQGERFQKIKAMALERVNKKMSLLESNKSCINSASSKSELKKCREGAMESHNKMKEEFKAKRMAFKNSKN